ncbi:MAG: Phosphoethanolamine transferase EptA [Candidatus Ordinivivax streblomastigis]|uniref:Phosphoethanolamine transferase EptA n=1 Tax=Candidatus Ordinivivax streblomastigis TaxID=2540710 RepID=A0A5M8NZI5_9BACT|nr:MAG: Phosphoethanolamine transferase EptA [Candidatus Ordinivivax streblomastigis]
MRATLKYYLFITSAILFTGIAFTSADFFTAPANSFTDVFILFLQWATLMAVLWPIIYLSSLNKYVFAVFYPLMCLVSSALTYFRYATGTIYTTAILDVLVDNHSQGTVLNFVLIGFVVLSIIIAIGFVIYQFKKITIRNKWIHCIIALILILILFHIPRIKSPVKNRIPFNLYFVTSRYFSERKEALTERPILSKQMTCEENDSLTVLLVIGESLRADHLGINDYSRNTTPYLSQEDIVSLSNIYSEYTYTDASVAHILTRADSIHPDLKYRERSFIDLFKQCGYRTAWLANQASTKSYVYFMNECDTLIYINANKSSYVFDKWMDGDLLPDFDSLLQKEQKQLIIMHTIGSHWYYNSHFPDEFQTYNPITKSRIVKSNTTAELINSYDNTVLYTDYFLHEIIDRLRDRRAILFFLSDHGEALGESGVWLHASDAPPIHRPACFVWMSPRYKNKHPDKYELLQQHKNQYYRTDFLFHTITEAGGIRGGVIDRRFSLF